MLPPSSRAGERCNQKSARICRRARSRWILLHQEGAAAVAAAVSDAAARADLPLSSYQFSVISYQFGFQFSVFRMVVSSQFVLKLQILKFQLLNSVLYAVASFRPTSRRISGHDGSISCGLTLNFGLRGWPW